MQARELQNEEIQTFVQRGLELYGPSVCGQIVFQIAGSIPENHLETIIEPLRKFVFHHSTRTKTWLLEALEHNDFPSQNVTVHEKRVWLQKIMRLVM